jgi:hypothetical protein
VRRPGREPAGEGGDHLASGPRSADVEEERAERVRPPSDAGVDAVFGDAENQPGVEVERRGSPGAPDRGSDGREGSDVSGGGEERGGGPERWHARTMGAAGRIPGIAPTRAQSNVASGVVRR